MLADTMTAPSEYLPSTPRLTKAKDAGQVRPAPSPVETTGEVSDSTLVARAQSGDRGAFGVLIQRYQRRVYQLALGIVRNHEEALDIVQDTFIKVHEHLANFKGDSAFFTWTYRIASNLSIDSVRRTRRGEHVAVDETTLTDAGDEHEVFSSRSASPQKQLLRRELSVELQRALATVSEQHRAIVILREIEGLSYEQLAETLGIPKGTVMSRLFHARQKLQKALAPYVNEQQLEGTTG
jgi:RNA polymerase sigma-70 factor (ECF subfamily)